MPSRPKQHVQETKCRLAIRTALPPEWVVEDIDEDYGRDMEVEIVADGKLTGINFAVQAKGTAEKKRSKAMKVRDVPYSHIEHWHNRRQPVLVALHLDAWNKLYGYWAHEQTFRDGTNPPLKSPRFSFSDEDELTEQRVAALERDIDRYVYTRTGRAQVPLRFVYRGARATPVLIADLAKRLREGVRLRVPWVPHEPLHPGDVALRISTDRVAIDVGGGMGATMHWADPGTELDAGETYNAVLLLLMKAFTDTRGNEFAAACAEQVVERQISMVFYPEFAEALVTCSLEVGRSELVLELARGMLATDPGAATVFAVLASRSVPQGEFADQLVEVARAAVDLQSGHQKGTAFYNLSNVLAATGKLEEALDASSNAAKWEPRYRDRDYWWKERASTLFNLDRFPESLEHYKHALGLLEDDDTAANVLHLAGDAALRTGDIDNAREFAERSLAIKPTTIGELLIAACRTASAEPALLTTDDPWGWLCDRPTRTEPALDEVLGAMFMRADDERLAATVVAAVASTESDPESVLDLFHIVDYCARHTELDPTDLLQSQVANVERVLHGLDLNTILERVMVVEAEHVEYVDPIELRIHDAPEPNDTN